MNELGWWIIPQVIVPYLIIGFLYAAFAMEAIENRSYHSDFFYVRDHLLKTRFRHQAIFVGKYMLFWLFIVIRHVWRYCKHIRAKQHGGDF